MDDMMLDGISLSHVALAKATQMVLNLFCMNPIFICRLGEGIMDDMVLDGISLSHVALSKTTKLLLLDSLLQEMKMKMSGPGVGLWK
jgi:hypothetical protein